MDMIINWIGKPISSMNISDLIVVVILIVWMIRVLIPFKITISKGDKNGKN